MLSVREWLTLRSLRRRSKPIANDEVRKELVRRGFIHRDGFNDYGDELYRILPEGKKHLRIKPLRIVARIIKLFWD